MPENGIRSRYSQSPVQILMYDEQGLISTGTAFFFEHDNETFLITNWHNISGRHFLAKTLLSNSGRTPTYIEAKFITNIFSAGSFTTCSHRIEIYENFEPVWLEHPINGSDCDIIAIRMDKPKEVPENMHHPSNTISKIRVPVKPGIAVFVIGFPLSISVHIGWPIWKSGYIASEPFYDITIGGEVSRIGGLKNGKSLPAFFVDTQTREGMSGSPVFANFIGTWDMDNPYNEVNPDDPAFWQNKRIALSENRIEFIGCYSGRIGAREDGASLGLCWPKSTITQVCSGQSKGKHPHVNLVS